MLADNDTSSKGDETLHSSSDHRTERDKLLAQYQIERDNQRAETKRLHREGLIDGRERSTRVANETIMSRKQIFSLIAEQHYPDPKYFDDDDIQRLDQILKDTPLPFLPRGVEYLFKDIRKSDEKPKEDKPPQSEDKPFVNLFPTRDEDRVAPYPKWLIKGLIEENTDNAIYAPGGFCKSFCALDIGYSVATGHLAFGTIPVESTGPVLYFAAEGYEDVRKRRRVAWEIHHGFEPYRVPDMWFSKYAPHINDDDLIHLCIRSIKERLGDRESKLFIIDTAGRAMNGEETDKAKTAHKFMNVMKRIREAVGGCSLVIGHEGKKRENGWNGSSQFPVSFDAMWNVKEHFQDPESRVHTLQLWIERLKSGDAGDNYYFQTKPIKIPDDPEERSSLVLLPIEQEEFDRASAMAKVREAKQKSMNRQEAKVTADTFRDAILYLAPNGYISSHRLFSHIANETGTEISYVTKMASAFKGELEPFKLRQNAWVTPDGADHDVRAEILKGEQTDE